MLTNPHEQHSWNKNQFMSNLSQISLKNHNHKTLNIRCFKPTKKGEGLLPQVEMNSFQSLWSNKPKIQAFGEEMEILWRLERKDGVSRGREKEEERIVIFFLSYKLSSNLLTMTKVLVTYPPLDQSQKSKLKP